MGKPSSSKNMGQRIAIGAIASVVALTFGVAAYRLYGSATDEAATTARDAPNAPGPMVQRHAERVERRVPPL